MTYRKIKHPQIEKKSKEQIINKTDNLVNYLQKKGQYLMDICKEILFSKNN